MSIFVNNAPLQRSAFWYNRVSSDKETFMSRMTNGSAALDTLPPMEAEVLTDQEVVQYNVQSVLDGMPEASLGQMFDRLRELDSNADRLHESKKLLLKKRSELRSTLLAENDVEPAELVSRVNQRLDGRRGTISSLPPFASDRPEAR